MSQRAEIVYRRTYSRPLNDEETLFETWPDTVARVITHQGWLWERALGRPLTEGEHAELDEFKALLLARKVGVAGRTLWLGGTETAITREASQFNCSFLNVETVHDVVDVMWLLLQGCGVGATPIMGTLNGFAAPIRDIRVVRSVRKGKGGVEHNVETFENGVWTIKIGDSGEAWAKAIGKLLSGKYRAHTLVFDLSEIREPGSRLKGYGWISSGDEVISKELPAIAEILNKRAGQLLRKIDIYDILTHLGVIQTGRRGAEIILFPYGQREWRDFADAKRDYFLKGLEHRGQSNNSLLFWRKPTREQLEEIFDIMLAGGGSEPGLINGAAAQKRAPWFNGVNPCGEILLSNKSFCNLTEVNLAAFVNDPYGLDRAIYLTARANYRQTLVSLDDGILQRTWHENNEYLHLCGVGITGIACRPDLGPYDYRRLRNQAVIGAYSMADELGTPRPKAVTTVKPSGTMSKLMDTTEGCHRPLGKYIFNNMVFSRHDPLVAILRGAGYKVIAHPLESDSVVITLPIKWDNVPFTEVDGREIDTETAIDQLNRYKMLMDNWVDHNCSITVSYEPDEVPSIIDWLMENWDSYVGVSFILRTSPLITAKDMGYAFLPQEVVTKSEYEAYVATLSEIDLDKLTGNYDIIDTDECAGGFCPVK